MGPMNLSTALLLSTICQNESRRNMQILLLKFLALDLPAGRQAMGPALLLALYSFQATIILYEAKNSFHKNRTR